MNELKKTIFKKRWWTKKRFLIFVLAFIACVVMSILRGLRQEIGYHDFSIFWGAARNFLAGNSLYAAHHVDGAQNFIYPPFAAIAFVIYGMLPLKIAGGLYYFMNLVLRIWGIYLIKLIFDHFYPNRNNLKWPLILAIVFTIRFFINNMNLLNINEVLFFICIAGIYCYLKGKINSASVLFTIAMFIKIIPIFFVIWIIFRSRLRAIIPVILTIALCCVLLIAFRGLNTATQDVSDYYSSFLKVYQKGHVASREINQNIAATIYRMLLPPESPEKLDFQYITASENTAKIVYKTSVVTVLVLFISTLVYLSLKNIKVSPFEVAFIFLVGSLLSGITWKAHLVMLLFVFMVFFSIDKNNLGKYLKIYLYILWGLMVIVGMAGKEILGEKAHDHFDGYSIIAWTLVILFFCSITASIRWQQKDLITEANKG